METSPTDGTLQMHVSNFQQRTVTIKPLASVLLPITFVPKIHSQTEKWEQTLLEKKRKRQKWLSKAAAADLADLIESDGFNLEHPGDLHLVETVLDIRTSRGKMVTLIRGSALKGNQYRIPHEIIFYNDGFVASGEILAEEERLNYLGTKKRGSGYTYDLHIRNPSDVAPMLFSEIYTTRPDLIQLSYQHDGKNRFNNCGSSYDRLLDCNSPNSHDIDGPPVIPIGTNMTYLVTISVKPEVQTMMVGKRGTMLLGELYIMSSNETLSIALRYSNTEVDNNYSEANYMKQKMTAGTEKSNKVPIEFQKNYQRRLDCDPIRNETAVMVDISPSLIKKQNQTQYGAGNHVSSPSDLDFGLLTRYGETREIGIPVTNNGNHSVRLMRYKVSLEIASVKEDGEADKKVVLLSMDGIDDEQYPIKAQVNVHDKLYVIPQGVLANDIVSLSVTSIARPKQNETFPIFCRGSILLHFGPSDMDFSEWKNSVINDPFGAQRDIVEVFFTVRIMYGSLQYDLRNIYFPTMMASFQTDKSKAITNSACKKGFHRTIHFTNNFPVSLQLTGLSIQHENSTQTHHHDNECKQFFEIYDFEGSKQNKKHSPLATAKDGDSWGAITLRYNYMPHSSEVIAVDKCVLVLDTDLAGSFFIPLHIYSAFTKFDSDQAVVHWECQNEDRSIKTFNLDCFNKALSMNDNLSLGSEMKNSKKINVPDLKSALTNEYIRNLRNSLPDEINRKEITMRPILLSLGSLSSHSVEKYSIYVKNYNPIPIVINATTSAIEGMEIRLAKTHLGISDFMKKAEGKVKHSQYQSNKWLKEILSTAKSSQALLESFVLCDHISPLQDVSDGMKRLFKQHAWLRFYPEEVFSTRNRTDAFHDELKSHPPPFQQLDIDSTFRGSSHFLMIGDKKIGLQKEAVPQPTWMIPPGGVAKLELLVKAPTLDVLSESDISEVLTAGVVLYSNIGEIIPIFASYQALSGSFKIVASSSSTNNVAGINHVQTKPIFRSKHSTEHISGERKDLIKQSFLIQNDFSTDVLLRKFNCCNRWMQIEIHRNVSDNSIESSEPLLIHRGETVRASVHSTIHCSPKDIGLAHPSFFHCVLEWLKDRQLLTSDECIKTSSEADREVSADIDQSLKKVTQSFSRVVTFLNEKYNHRSRHGVSSYKNLPYEVSDIFNEAFNEWKTLCNMGQNIVTGNVQAQFELMANSQSNSITGGKPQMITTMLEKFRFSTALEVPRLFDVHSKLLGNFTGTQRNNIIDFGVTPISKSSKAFIPVVNPTGHTIRARLVVCRECSAANGDSSVFVQSKSRMKHPWWTGGSYFLADEKGGLLISNHNVTIETSSGSSLSLMNPSLHSSSAFTRGCTGRRCGGAFPEANNAQHDYLQKVSPIGSSSSTTGSLNGRIYDVNGKSERIKGRGFSPHKYPPFALSSKSIEEVTLPPFSSTMLGPLYFRPTSRSHFKALVWLENSFTGLERIDLTGTGGLEKIVFLETDDMNAMGGTIETRFNKPTLMFQRMKDEPYGPLIRNVLVANLGDVEVTFNGFRLREAQVTGQQNFSGEENFTRCKKRGFHIIDCIDHEDNPESSDTNSFTLKPKEAKQLRLMHKADCSFRSLSVSLVLDFADGDNIEERKSLELLLGYNLNESDVEICSKRLIRHNRAHYHKRGIVKVSSLILPLAILGLILIDILNTVRRRRLSSMDFRTKATMTSNKTGFKNWVVAFRCLSRGEHDSTDLTNLSKEHTRQILLARYRKDGMLHPQCILQSGALNRERHVFSGNGTENTTRNSNATPDTQMPSTPTSRRTATTVAKTLSESLFALVRSSKGSCINEYSGAEILVPHGLDWKKAVRSGIVQWTGRSNKRQSKVDLSKKVGYHTTKKAFPHKTSAKDHNLNQVQVTKKEGEVGSFDRLRKQKSSPTTTAQTITHVSRQKSKNKTPSSNAPSTAKVPTDEMKTSNKATSVSKLIRSKERSMQSKQPVVDMTSHDKIK